MGRLAHRCLAGGCGFRSRRLLRSNCSTGVAIQAEARERQGQGIAPLRAQPYWISWGRSNGAELLPSAHPSACLLIAKTNTAATRILKFGRFKAAKLGNNSTHEMSYAGKPIELGELIWMHCSPCHLRGSW